MLCALLCGAGAGLLNGATSAPRRPRVAKNSRMSTTDTGVIFELGTVAVEDDDAGSEIREQQPLFKWGSAVTDVYPALTELRASYGWCLQDVELAEMQRGWGFPEPSRMTLTLCGYPRRGCAASVSQKLEVTIQQFLGTISLKGLRAWSEDALSARLVASPVSKALWRA